MKILRAVIAFGLLLSFGAMSSPLLAQDIFTSAIRDQSTSPRILLVTIEHADGSQRVIATIGMALMNALMKERGFEEKPDALAIAQRAALIGRGRPFRFTKPDALKLIEPPYTPEILDEVRKKIGGLIAPDLAARLGKMDGFKDVYPADSELRHHYQFAIAHVLMEKGLAVQFNCLDGSLGSAQ